MGYEKKDAAKDTGASPNEVARAWHDARDDAQAEGQLPEREAHKSGQGYETPRQRRMCDIMDKLNSMGLREPSDFTIEALLNRHKSGIFSKQDLLEASQLIDEYIRTCHGR